MAAKVWTRLASGRGVPAWREMPALVRAAFRDRRTGAYDAWVAANGWTGKDRAALCERLSAAGPLPRISIVTPVFRPNLALFEQTAQSVRDQISTDWEWCIADDASGDDRLTNVLARLAAEDSRIRIVTRAENGHISRASNSAAALASCDFLAFLDHDDLLSPDALAEVGMYLAAHPETDLLYSDDDKVDAHGRRFGPQFKPDWSPESLLSQMYLAHLLVMRRSLFERVGGFRGGFEGSQDHDLALRATELAREVGHVPLVLYHWRAIEGSTAASGDAKPYSFDAGLRAVEEALARRGVPAKAERPEWAVSAGASLIRHRFPDEGPSVVILVAARDQTSRDRCVRSLEMTSYRNFNVVAVDVQTCRDLARAFNGSARKVGAEYLVFLDADLEVRAREWLSQMIGFAQLPGVGVVGARLIFPHGSVAHAGVVQDVEDGSIAYAFRGLPTRDPGYLASALVCRNYSAVSGRCLLTPRPLFLEVGGFDEAVFPGSLHDVDYCYRLVDNGYRCVYAAEAELVDHGAAANLPPDTSALTRFRERYRGRRDPYANPNLAAMSADGDIQPRVRRNRIDRLSA